MTSETQGQKVQRWLQPGTTEWEYLEGDLSFEEMSEKAIIATRQLAKRQLTWLRKEQNCNFYDINSSIYPKILKNLKNLL